MSHAIQIAYLGRDYQRIIDFDRDHPAQKIIVFVKKSHTSPNSKQYKSLKEALSKLRTYCQLTKIRFNMQVIDLASADSFLHIVFTLAKSLLIDFELNAIYNLNLGDTSLVINIALIQAANLLKALYDIEINAYISEEDYFVTSFKYSIVPSFKSLVSPPVSHLLLDCIDKNMNFTEIKTHYERIGMKISMGTIYNYVKHLETLGLVVGKKSPNRSLTPLGKLVKDLLDLKHSLFQ